MHLRSKLLAFSWLVCTLALPTALYSQNQPAGDNAAPAAGKLAALKTQLAALTTPDEKIAFLNNQLQGQDNATLAALGADLIASVPANSQNDIAGQVAQMFAQAKGNTTDTPQLIGLLTSKLTPEVASQVAASIAIGASKGAPAQTAQITAAVIVAQPSTIANAGPIVAAVTAAVPVDMASKIATAIGKEYAAHPTLVAQAPQIAAAMTSSLLTQGPDSQTKSPIADSIAALTVLLPDPTGANKDVVTAVGTATSAVLSTNHPEVVTQIVGTTAQEFQANATPGTKPVVIDFANTFQSNITDPALQARLTSAVTEILAGTTKSIDMLMNNPVTDPNQQNGNQNSNTGNISYTQSQVNKPETNTLPQ